MFNGGSPSGISQTHAGCLIRLADGLRIYFKKLLPICPEREADSVVTSVFPVIPVELFFKFPQI